MRNGLGILVLFWVLDRIFRCNIDLTAKADTLCTFNLIYVLGVFIYILSFDDRIDIHRSTCRVSFITLTLVVLFILTLIDGLE